jgi:hypothetical protein
MGYHYDHGSLSTISAEMSCQPSSGTLPFSTNMVATITNKYPAVSRRMAGRIDVTLGNGSFFSYWKAGNTPIGPGESYVETWQQNIPAVASLVGTNIFTLVCEDVTFAPYNNPPYAPSGDSSASICIVVGIHP